MHNCFGVLSAMNIISLFWSKYMDICMKAYLSEVM